MNEEKLIFKGSQLCGLIPFAILIVIAVYLLGFAGSCDGIGLALAGYVGIIIGSFFAISNTRYWDAVIKGMSDELGGSLILILIVVNIFGKMMTRGHITEGFVWLSDVLSVGGTTLCAFAFIISAIIAASMGSSFSTILTITPILLPVAAIVNANIPLFVGAVMSGALWGDTIGPVSDVTIASSQTQEYKHGKKRPDIAGVVGNRFKYSMIAFAITLVIFIILGSGGNKAAISSELLHEYSDPAGLFMLIPMIVLLIFAFKTKNLYLSATMGTIAGVIVGLVTGIMTPADIIAVENGTITGFIVDGLNNILAIAFFIYAILGLIGILRASGIMETIIEKITSSKMGQSVVGTELILAIGSSITCVLLGGNNGPSCLMFGEFGNQIGKKANLHPYRRANIIAAFSSTLPVMIPFTSVFIAIAMGAVNGVRADFAFIPEVSPIDISQNMIFCLVYPLVFLVSILTGWGRDYEGQNGEVVKNSKKKDQLIVDKKVKY